MDGLTMSESVVAALKLEGVGRGPRMRYDAIFPIHKVCVCMAGGCLVCARRGGGATGLGP